MVNKGGRGMFPQKNFDSEFFSRSVVHLEFCTRGGEQNKC